MKYALITLLILLSSYLKSQHTDKNDARIICRETKEIIVNEFFGSGEQEKLNTSCFPSNFKEVNSYWLLFKSDKNQILEFKISPLKQKDDIDFMVLDSDNRPLRCVSSGINTGESYTQYNCNQSTGLISDENKKVEFKGCQNEDTNFAAALELKKGELYYIYIHNSSSSSGVRLNFLNNLEFSDHLILDKESMNIDEAEHNLVNLDFRTQTKMLTWNMTWANPASSNSLESFTTELNLLNDDILIKKHSLKNSCVVETHQVFLPTKKNEISVTIGDISLYSLYPNPTSSKINVVLETQEFSAEVQLKLISLKGEVITEKMIVLERGIQEIQLNVENIAPQNILLSVSNNGKSENFQITKI